MIESLSRLPSGSSRSARWRRGARLALLATFLAVPALAGASLRLDGDPREGHARVVPGPERAAAELAWSWRWAGPGGWTDWYKSAPSSALDLPAAPPRARAVEVRAERNEDDRPWRDVLVAALGASVDRPLRDPGRRVLPRSTRGVAKAPTVLIGRLAYRDRLFDLGGYTGGTRTVPVRAVHVVARRASDGAALARGTTDALGDFRLEFDLAASGDLALEAVASLEGEPGLRAVVRPFAASPDTVRMTVATFTSVAPGLTLDAGTLEMPDSGPTAAVQAFHLLDLLLSAAQMLGDPAYLADWPSGGLFPDLIWAPDAAHSVTGFVDGALRVRSPLSGDSDGWSDGPVLAALGQWVLSEVGVLTHFDPPDFVDAETTPARALDLGSAWTFAAAVRAWRGLRVRDVDGVLAESGIPLLVDLPSPPPLGFSAGSQAGVDLERRLDGFGAALPARGQIGVWNVAAMGWDLADDALARDGDSVDDDGVDRGAAIWFQMATQGVQGSGGHRFEDLVEAWKTQLGDDAAVDAVAIGEGGCALFDDPAEVDDTPVEAPAVAPWAQPALSAGGTVQIHELYLDDRDGVELYHGGTEPLDLGGWTVTVARNGFAGTASRTTTLAPGTWIAPGRSLVLWEGAGTNGALERFDPAWVVPWTTDEDGACTLRDDLGAVRDFVRWAGARGIDPSLEPVPAGTSFVGQVASPGRFGETLGRDATGTDTDHASDFRARIPTPRLPNLDATLLRTLRPSDDVDHLGVKLGAPSLLEVHAWGVADDARPRWRVVDAGGIEVTAAPTLPLPSRGSWLRTRWDPHENVFLRLEQDPAGASSAAVRVALWVPADPRSAQPVADLRARPLKVDLVQDDVLVEWTPQSPSQGYELWIDGQWDSTLGPDETSAVRSLGLGSHVVELRASYAGATGAPVRTGCWVGVTPCAASVGFEASVPFALSGMAVDDEAAIGSHSLHDALAGAAYPPDDVATATLVYPVDLTSDSVLRFRHAAHLEPDGDFARVQLSADDGVTWVELARWDGSDQPGSGAGAPDWTDGVLLPGDWVQEQFDLGAWAGERVRLRFSRESNASGTSIGWWIDEVEFGTDPGTQWWVSATGSDLFGCGARERPLATVAAALPALDSGDTLRLGAGEFSESIGVTREGAQLVAALPVPAGVAVRGAGSDSTRIVVADGIRGVVPLGPGARVEGLAVEGGEIALDVESSTLFATDLRVAGAASAAVVVGGDLELSESSLRQGDLGLIVVGGAARLDRCTVDGFRLGVLVAAGPDSVRIERSLVTNCSEVAVQGPGTGGDFLLRCSGIFGAPTLLANVEPGQIDQCLFVDPVYCAVGQGDLRLASPSPYLDVPGCGRVGAFDQGCDQVVVAVPPSRGAGVSLGAAFPNPFNPRTTLRFELAEAGPVRLELYDLRGRRVRRLVRGDLGPGAHEVVWRGVDDRGREVSSGVYTAVLRAGNEERRRTLVLLR